MYVPYHIALIIGGDALAVPNRWAAIASQVPCGCGRSIMHASAVIN